MGVCDDSEELEVACKLVVSNLDENKNNELVVESTWLLEEEVWVEDTVILLVEGVIWPADDMTWLLEDGT